MCGAGERAGQSWEGGLRGSGSLKGHQRKGQVWGTRSKPVFSSQHEDTILRVPCFLNSVLLLSALPHVKPVCSVSPPQG